MAGFRIDTSKVWGAKSLAGSAASSVSQAQLRLGSAFALDPGILAKPGIRGRLRAVSVCAANAHSRVQALSSFTEQACQRYEQAEADVLARRFDGVPTGKRPSVGELGGALSAFFAAAWPIVAGAATSDWRRIVDGDLSEKLLMLVKWSKTGLTSAVSATNRRFITKSLPEVARYMSLGPRGGYGAWNATIKTWGNALSKPLAGGMFAGALAGALELHDSIKRGDSGARTASNTLVVGGAVGAGAWAGAAVGTAICPVVGTIGGIVVGAAAGWVVNQDWGGWSVKSAVGDFSEKVAAPAIGNAVGAVTDFGESIVGGTAKALGDIGGSVGSAFAGVFAF